jgi:hypothetical protein
MRKIQAQLNVDGAKDVDGHADQDVAEGTIAC